MKRTFKRHILELTVLSSSLFCIRGDVSHAHYYVRIHGLFQEPAPLRARPMTTYVCFRAVFKTTFVESKTNPGRRLVKTSLFIMCV